MTSLFSFYSIHTHLKSCKILTHLHQIHAHIVQRGLEQDHFIITQFICLCISLSDLSYVATIFDRVNSPNIYLWNSLIRGHCESPRFLDTLSVFKRMKLSNTSPDRYTYPSLVKACATGSILREGMMIHGSAVRQGTEEDVVVRSSLIDMYGKCNEIVPARRVFDTVADDGNVVAWTAMIVGYASVGDSVEAKKLFDQMPKRNITAWNAMIGGYVKCGDLVSARKMFDAMPEKNVVSFTTMIGGYAKAGDMASARFLFERAPYRDIVAWSALISGYEQNGQPKEAVKVFFEMESRNVRPDEFVLVSLMSACSQVGNLELAKWVDAYQSQNTSVSPCQEHVVAALIDMNAKCGNMERATMLFEEMPERDIISYCSMIQGLSIHGRGAQAVHLFDRMIDEGLAPDGVAFTVILAACSHAGLVEEGCYYFDSMRNDYSIVPSPDHYACMVDLFGRSGRLEEAYDLIKSMPVEPHAGAWGALLGACRLHYNIEIGKAVASHLFELEPHHAGSYVLLSNIYAAADQWLDVSLVRCKMNERGVRKIGGCSWI